jgi:hypothetical protein
MRCQNTFQIYLSQIHLKTKLIFLDKICQKLQTLSNRPSKTINEEN